MNQITNLDEQEELTIKDFDGKTFVAFLDISGFKKLMTKNKALDALDIFYQSGYDILKQKEGIDGLFVSDCGILFVRESTNTNKCLSSLLNVIGIINKKMLEHGFMLTTSIAYGSIRYQKRLLLKNMSKNAIYGQAYVDAFLDNENWTPKIQPGQCRIITKSIPQEINLSMNNDNLFRCVKERDGDDGHLYYYWNVTRHDQIHTFEDAYKESEDAKYTIIKNALNEKKTALVASDY